MKKKDLILTKEEQKKIVDKSNKLAVLFLGFMMTGIFLLALIWRMSSK